MQQVALTFCDRVRVRVRKTLAHLERIEGRENDSTYNRKLGACSNPVTSQRLAGNFLTWNENTSGLEDYDDYRIYYTQCIYNAEILFEPLFCVPTF
jgi:hypothetical protein